MGKDGGGGGGGGKNKSKAKMYYLKQARAKNRGGGGGRNGGGDSGRFSKLTVGMKGFLCTTNYNEKNAVKEAYNLLNEYHADDDETDQADVEQKADESSLYSSQIDVESDQINVQEGGDAPELDKEDQDSRGREGQSDKTEDSKPGNTGISGPSNAKKTRVDSDDEDVESALAAEITRLKSSQVKYKFQSVDTGVRNLVFISTTIKDPVKLAHKILKDLSEKKVQKSRYLLRLIPVEAVCRAEIADIKKTAESLFPKYFKTGFNTFQVVYKSRYNDSLERAEVIRTVASTVMDINTFNSVNLTDPKYFIIVEIFRNMCCIGVVPDFNKFRKYNLIEVASSENVKVQAKSHQEDAEQKQDTSSATEEQRGVSAEPTEQVGGNEAPSN